MSDHVLVVDTDQKYRHCIYGYIREISESWDINIPNEIGQIIDPFIREHLKLKLEDQETNKYRKQLKQQQQELASMRHSIQEHEDIIENLQLRYDLGIIQQDKNKQRWNLSDDEFKIIKLRRKAEALTTKTILENFELRNTVNESRDKNSALRNKIYELQDRINNEKEKQKEKGTHVQEGTSRVEAVDDIEETAEEKDKEDETEKEEIKEEDDASDVDMDDIDDINGDDDQRIDNDPETPNDNEGDNELNDAQKLQLAERANEIFRQQIKYSHDHVTSLTSLFRDKDSIIDNLILRYDLGVVDTSNIRADSNTSADEIEMKELAIKAKELAHRTTTENFELREMVNELRDENWHLENEIFELEDKINELENSNDMKHGMRANDDNDGMGQENKNNNNNHNKQCIEDAPIIKNDV